MSILPFLDRTHAARFLAEALARVAELADEVVCLAAPADFSSVGAHYLQFEQVEDAEVVATLQQSRVTRSRRP